MSSWRDESQKVENGEFLKCVIPAKAEIHRPNDPER